MTLADELKRIFDDAGGSDTLALAAAIAKADET